MKPKDFLRLLDEVIEADPGTVEGTELLTDLPKWDSLAVLSFIAAVDTHFHIQISAEDLAACQTVPDLEKLLGNRITA